MRLPRACQPRKFLRTSFQRIDCFRSRRMLPQVECEYARRLLRKREVCRSRERSTLKRVKIQMIRFVERQFCQLHWGWTIITIGRKPHDRDWCGQELGDNRKY